MLRAASSHPGDPRHHDHLDAQVASAHPRSRSPGGDSLLTVRIPGNGASRRESVVHERYPSDSSHGDEGLANLNRWSQSTASSVASNDGPPTATKPSHGFSSASIWARRNPHTAQSPEDVSPRTVAHARPPPVQSPEYSRRRVPRFEKPLPPAMSISNHSPNDEALLTASTFTPSSTGLLTPASYNNTDYFGGSATADRSPQAMPPRTSSRAASAMSRHHDSPGGSGAGRRDKDKKTMLSKALEKANTAVLLDNALNYEGALEAYQDACRLLEHVMDRTSAPDDRRKLDAIRDTYTVRVEELLQIQMTTASARQDKKLPPRPMSDESLTSPVYAPDRDSAIIETAVLTRIVDAPPSGATSPAAGSRASFLTNAIREVEGTSSAAGSAFLGPLWERERSKSPFRDSTLSDQTAHPHDELDAAFMPRPLTPQRRQDQEPDSLYGSDFRPASAESNEPPKQTDPVSWLDTIDESDSSASPSNTTTSTRSRTSSVHSHSPKRGLHRRDLSQAPSHASLDFDAAFDAAVEAAYEDGYEIDHGYLPQFLQPQDDQAVPGLDLDIPPPPSQFHMFGDAQLDDDEAEEERILDEITNDYIDHGFDFDIQSKSALPRQSDSSTYSSRTWQSSQISNRTTAGTSLSTVAETALPQLPNANSLHTPSASVATHVSTASTETSTSAGAQQASVQTRRTAGPNFKQLKIETARKPSGLRSRGYTNTEPPKETVDDEDTSEADRRISEVPSLRHVEAALASPYHMRSAVSDTATSMSLESSVPDSADTVSSNYRSPRPRLFRGQNKSSISLRDHTGFISEEPDTAPGSPMSTYPVGDGPVTSRRYITPSGGSIGGSFTISRTDSATRGYHVFENYLSPPNQPPSPGADDSLSPSSLEPCPEPLLLRPFWLLRCIASSINQPRGGFLTTRLFIPREAWLNRSIKLKGVEDKIANCDLLTAALGKLTKVDTYDADAILDELQSFEEVMERVQAVLIKKLGSEVGVQGASALFKESPVPIDSTGTTVNDPKDGKPNKSYLSSWRKLRGKNSTGGVTIPLSSSKGDKDVATMSSVPMTSFVPVDKRTAHKHSMSKDTSFEGPHKDYMSSVSRLCEAAQILDQVARQVEDPGLKHSSPTHIGLELSTRHAAEFFGFYICRFVLGDIMMLMDKYVKRNTEWILT